MNNRYKRQEGQGLVEYALILSLVALVSVFVLTALGQGLSNVFTRINCAINRDTACAQPSAGNGDACPNENLIVDALQCLDSPFTGGGQGLTMFARTNCQGANLTLQGYGPLLYSAAHNDYHYTWLSDYHNISSACDGVSDYGLANGSFTIISVHPDGRTVNHSFSN